MGKAKRKEAQGADDKAVMALRMDSSTPESPREVQPPAGGGFQTPCTLTGVMAGLSGGSLGYVFGFGEWQGGAAVPASGFEPPPPSPPPPPVPPAASAHSAHCLPGCAWLTPAGGYWMRMRRSGQWKASLAEGWGSAKVGWRCRGVQRHLLLLPPTAAATAQSAAAAQAMASRLLMPPLLLCCCRCRHLQSWEVCTRQ